MIGDRETVTGFRLAGVENGHIVETPEDVEKALDRALSDPETGLVILTSSAAEMTRRWVELIKLRPKPVVVEIPDKTAVGRKLEDPLRAFIRRVVGVDVLRGD